MYIEEEIPENLSVKELKKLANEKELTLEDYVTSLIMQIEYESSFDEASEYSLLPLTEDFFNAIFINDELKSINLIKVLLKEDIINSHDLQKNTLKSIEIIFDTSASPNYIRDSYYFELLIKGYSINSKIYIFDKYQVDEKFYSEYKNKSTIILNKYLKAYKNAIEISDEEVFSFDLNAIQNELEDRFSNIQISDITKIERIFQQYRKKYSLKTISKDYYTFHLNKENFFSSEDTVNDMYCIKYCTARINIQEIIELFEKFGYELFEGNVRYFLTSQSNVSKEIKSTLSDNEMSNYFWHLNNGLFIIANKVELDENTLELRVEEPRIINGCQTTVSIYNNRDSIKNKDINIMIKIVELNESELNKIDDNLYLKLKRSIIKGTNTQQAIYNYDIVTLDPIHERLTKEFNKLEIPYFYEFKRGIWQTVTTLDKYLKQESQNKTRKSKRDYNIIPMIESTQAYFSLIGFPSEAKAKRSLLFDEGINGFYNQIFNDKLSALKLLFSFIIFNFVNQRSKEFYKEFSRIKDKINFHLSNKPTDINYDEYLEQKLTRAEYELVKKQFIPYSTYHIVSIIGLIFSTKYESSASSYLDKKDMLNDFLFHDQDFEDKIKKLISTIEIRLEAYFHIKRSKEVSFSFERFFKNQNSFTLLADEIKTDLRIYSAMGEDPYTPLI